MANPYVRPVLALDMVEARSEVRPGGPTNRSVQKHTCTEQSGVHRIDCRESAYALSHLRVTSDRST
jgi:hypothetical protein